MLHLKGRLFMMTFSVIEVMNEREAVFASQSCSEENPRRPGEQSKFTPECHAHDSNVNIELHMPRKPRARARSFACTLDDCEKN